MAVLHLLLRHQMQMKVIDDLPSFSPDVEREAVSRNPFLLRKLLCFGNEHPGDILRRCINRENGVDVGFWNEEEMSRCFWELVTEDHDFDILKEDIGGDFFIPPH